MHHRIFDIDEILRHVLSWVVRMRRWKDAINLACCRKAFEEPVLSTVWEKSSLKRLARILPEGLWGPTTGSVGNDSIIILRPPTRSEHERLLQYASWIRVLEVDTRHVGWTKLEAFQVFSPDGPLCQKIQKLDWSGSAPAFRFLPLFFPPTIRSFCISAIRFRNGDEDVGIENEVLAEIIPRLNASTLTRVQISVSPSLTPGVQEEISSLVLRCGPALISLEITKPLSEPAFLHAITLPNLREFSVHNRPPPKVPESTTIFPSLDRFNLTTVFHSQWVSFIGSRPSRNSRTPMTNELGTPHSTLQTLAPFSHGGSGPVAIGQTPAFVNLTTLNIPGLCPGDGTCAFSLTDNDVDRLAIALPRLTYLMLGAIRCGRNACKTTFRSYLSLSVYCSELCYLEIHINTDDILSDIRASLGAGDPEMGKPGPHRKCRLRLLDLNSTPLELPSHSDCESIARGLLDVFPMLVMISVWDEQGRNNMWRRVQQQISRLRTLDM